MHTDIAAGGQRAPLFAVGLLSATALGYEILLIRLFSIIQWHHFAYMIISLALLGYGASGTFLAVARRLLRGRYETAFIVNVVLFGLCLLPCFLFAQSVTFNPEQLLWEVRQIASLALVYGVLSLPFFFAANAIALTFMHYRRQISGIYAVDLLGAGSGSLIIVVLLFSLQPLDALRVLAVCGLGCAAFAAWEIPLRYKTPLSVLTLILIAATLLLGAGATLESSAYKDLSQSLRVSGATIVDQRSSPLSLLHVVENRQIPLRHAPGMSINARTGPPEQLSIFADGDSIGAITRDSGERAALAFLDQLPSALPYHLRTLQRVLILGGGDSMSVLQARFQGASGIDALELDPLLIELLAEDHDAFSGGLYTRPGVRIHIGDARGFIRSHEQRYDLIHLPAPGASGAVAAGLHALREDYRYTTEALSEYLDRLNDNGYLLATPWMQLPPRNTLKLLATARDALKASGVAHPDRHLILIRGWQVAALLIGKRAFTADEIERLHTFCRARAFDLAWYPGISEGETNRHNRLTQAWFYGAARALLGEQAEAFTAGYKFDITPARDNRPYFNNFFKWSSVEEILALREQGGLALLEAGYPVLLTTLLQALVLSGLIILLPLPALGKPVAAERTEITAPRVLLYFGAIGLAFLFIEIAFIQKFMLFLHHPLITTSTVLAAFLVFAGLGSYWTQRVYHDDAHRPGVRLPVALILACGIGGIASLDALFLALAGWPLAARIVISILMIAPLAFFMGMPFPRALSALGSSARHLIPLAWGINGCMSVISAVLATALAIHIGFSAVVALALALYALAAFFFPRAAAGAARG